MSSSDTAASPQQVPQRRSPLHTRVLALVASLSMILIGLVGIVMAPAASAHSNSVTGTAVCQNDGTWKITWKIANDYKYGLKITQSNRAAVPVPTTMAKYETKSFTETVNAAATYTLTIKSVWDTDGYSRTNTGSVKISGTCTPKTYQGSYDAKGSIDYCKAGVDGTAPWGPVKFTATSNVSVVDANAQAKAKADTDAADSNGLIAAAKAAAVPAGADPGKCTDHTGTFEVSGTIDICTNGVDGTAPWGPVTFTATSRISDADAKAKAEADSKIDKGGLIAAAKAAAVPEGSEAGKCQEHKGEVVVKDTVTFCDAGVTKTKDWSVTFTATSMVSDAVAQGLAQTKADNDEGGLIAAAKASALDGHPEGACTEHKGEVTVTGTVYFCKAGDNGSADWSVKFTATSMISDDDAKAQAQKLADADATDANGQIAAAKAKALDGATEGECTVYEAERTVGGEGTYCLAGETKLITWSGFASATSTISEQDAIDKAIADATKLSDQNKKDQTAGATEGACKGSDPKTYTYSKQVTITQDICTPAGSVLGATATGDRISETQDSEFTKAQTDAIDTKAGKSATTAFNAKYPDFTDGACAAVTGVALAPLAATVPAPAKKPVVVAAPKPAKVNGGVAGTVTVPEAATVPAAVPAGDGSQSPGLPLWALTLMVIGAAGAFGASKNMLGARK